MPNPILYLLNVILSLWGFVIFTYIILLWLIHFRVVNYSQQFVKAVYDVLVRLNEPVLNKIRRFVKPINGVDISPVILVIAIYFVQYTLRYYFW